MKRVDDFLYVQRVVAMPRASTMIASWAVLLIMLVLGVWLFGRPVQAGAPVSSSVGIGVANPGLPLATTTPETPTPNPSTCGQWSIVPSPNIGTQSNALHGVAVVGPNDVWAVGGYSLTTQTLVERWNGSQWSIVPSPNQGTSYNYLDAVAVVAPNDVWAVGSYYNTDVSGYETLVERWNGSQWSIVPSPSVGTYNELHGIAVAGPSDIWAVGYHDNTPQTLILHWNGSGWSIVSSPNPGTQSNRLEGVAVVATNDVWAVGNYNSGDTNEALILRWNGSQWSVVPGPAQQWAHSILNGVAAVAPNDVWAVGNYNSGLPHTLVEHWNGSQWSIVPSPSEQMGDNQLYGVAAIAPNNVWAIGHSSGELIEHWNGSQWSIVPGSNEGSPALASTAAEGNEVWAVGSFSTGGAYPQTLTERYVPCPATPTVTGTPPTATRTANPVATATATVTQAPAPACGLWSVVQSPNQGEGSNAVHAVAASAPNDVWAVGAYYEGTLAHTLVEHWNGTQWSIVPSPNQGTSYNYLYAVAAVATNDVWAVGYYVTGDGERPLIEHWNGTQWSIMPNPVVGTSELYGVAEAGPNDVWAVGQYYSFDYRYATLVERWNGTQWSIVPSPNQSASNNYLNAVVVAGPNDVWAVGHYDSSGGVSQTLVERFNGTQWSIVPSPNNGTGDNQLNAVAASTTNDVWTVGYFVSNNAQRALVERWNGTQWTIASFPSQWTAEHLNGISVADTNDVWVAGYTIHSIQETLVAHWNGSVWTVMSSPSPGSYGNELQSITMLERSTIWAVGRHYSINYLDQTLVERYMAFTDVPAGSTFYTYVTCLVNRGIISGYSDCSFRPNNNVTRGQLAKIVSNAAIFSDQQSTQLFQDVPVGSTFFQYIGRLASRGYMNGYECGGPGEQCVPPNNLPYFRPNNKASRGQLTKIVSNAAGFQGNIPTSVQTFMDVPPNSTFWVYVERLLLNRPGVMGGYPCGGANEPCDPQQRPYFRPANNVTRGQASKIVANTFFPGCQSLAMRK